MGDPPNRFDRPGGGKYYKHPLTDEIYDSVTTVLDVFDKDGLKIWAAMLAADQAFELLPQITQSLIEQPCGNTYNRCYQKHGRENRCERCPCGVCERCVHRRLAWYHAAESARRAEEGTELHAAINHWVVTGGDRMTLRPEVQPYFRSFLAWVTDYGLQPNIGNTGSWMQTEATLLNRTHMYAGTSDAVLWLARGHRPDVDAAIDKILGPGQSQILARVDWKSREKPDTKLYNDMPLQGVAYENCEAVLLPNGEELPMVHTQVRAILQIHPYPDGSNPKAKSYSFSFMRTDREEFDAFLALLTAYRWMQQRGGSKAFGLDAVVPQPPALPTITTSVTPVPELAAPAPVVAPYVQRVDETVQAVATVATVLDDPWGDGAAPAGPAWGFDAAPPMGHQVEPNRCPNCLGTLDGCNTSGCGQRKRPGWRDQDLVDQPLPDPQQILAQAGLRAEPVIDPEDPPPFDGPYQQAGSTPPPPAKKAARKAAKKAATPKAGGPADPFDAWYPRKYPVGTPGLPLLDEQIPF